MKKIPFQDKLNESFKRYADHTAVVWGEKGVSYSELQKKSQAVTRWIIREGIEEGHFIGICLDDRIDLISAMIGILNARCVFVILDAVLPQARLKNMIRLTDTQILFVDTKNKKRLSDDNGAAVKTVIVNDSFYRDPESYPSPVAEMEKGIEYNREDRIYVYFTSGSTGQPRAIVGKNKSLLHFIDWEIETFGIDQRFCISQLAAPGFDAFLRDVFAPLCAGAAVCIPPHKEMMIDSREFIRWIDRQQITLIHCVPSLFRIFNSEHLVPGNFKSLRYVLLSGERMLPPELQNWFNVFGERIRLVNLYGTTETTMAKTCYFIREPDTQRARIPAGKPINGAQVFVFDKNMNICGKGFAGEIYIRTPFRTFGYYNDLKANEERFIPNPFTRDRNDLFHRTGDIGRILNDDDENIDVLGRVDRQVKIRGIRIELEEIEYTLSRHTVVKEAVVIDREDRKGDKYLCGYFVSGRDISAEELKEYLLTDLPDYMVPLHFVQLEKIPLTSRGKVDLQALPEPKLKAGADYVAPRNVVEESLVRIWSEVLGVEKDVIGINSSFFELGGHSLRATFMVERVHKELNVKLPLAEVFKKNRIRELSEFIRGLGEDTYTAIEPVEKKDRYPLSSAQKRLYILQQMNLEGTVYNMPRVIPLPEEPDAQRLEWTFLQLIQRHESLRTSFAMVEEQPVQRVHDNVEFKIESYGFTAEQADVEIDDFVRPFDLGKAPLFKAGLIKTGDRAYIMIIDMHHIITDGVSLGILEKEFMILYNGGRVSELPVQYKDFSEWQNSEKGKEKMRRQEIYWLDEFETEVTVLDMPTDYPRPEIQSFEGSTLGFEISGEDVLRLKAIALKENATLYMTLLAVYNVFLSKLTGLEEVVIGAPIAGRRHADLESIIGMFVNTLVMRNYPNRETSFLEFLGNLKEKALGAFDNQDYQFEDLVENVAVNRDAARNPLFDVVFILQNMLDNPGEVVPGTTLPPDEVPDLEDVHRQYRYENRTSKFDMTLMVIEARASLLFIIQYSTKLFKEETIQRFIAFFKRIVSFIVREPTVRLSGIELISGEEKEKILYEFNDTGSEYPETQGIHQIFEAYVEKMPDDIAVVDAGHPVPFMVTYRELNRRADGLSVLIRDKGIAVGGIVGLMTEPSVEMAVGLLAVLKAGGAYLPVNPEYPGERKRYLLEDGNVKLLLTNCSPDRTSVPGADIGVIDLTQRTETTLPAHLTHLTPHSQRNPAYVIYTSGSTGIPKGVMVDHRSVVRLVKNTGYVQFRKGDRILQTGALEFDASTFEIWGGLLNGLVLCLAPKETVLMPLKLKETIHVNKIDTMWMTSPLFNRMVDEDIEIFQGLGTLLVGGDVLSPPHIMRVRKGFPGLKIINGYGPTENTTFSTTFVIDKEYEGSIPIGKPIANSTAYIVDKSDHLAPIGVAGELLAGGHGVAMGYLNKPELTAEKFIMSQRLRDFHHSSLIIQRSARLYKTGDLARWLADGNIRFLGRIDQQVKVRGFRIELEEIENRLLNHEGVIEAVVVARGGESGDKDLCAYIVPGRADETLPAALKGYLSHSLPGYMIPSYFTLIEQVPLTSNGKIDRKALPTPEVVTEAEYAAPRNEAEKKLAAIWAEVLGIGSDKIGINDSFFEIGGHSLRATILISKIHKEFNVNVPLGEVFRTPSIRGLALYIEGTAQHRYVAVEVAEKKEYYPLSRAQHGLYVEQQRNPDSIAYNMPQAVPLNMLIDKEQMESAFNKVIHRHESLRISFDLVEDKPVQKVHTWEDLAFKIEFYDGPAPSDFVRPFDLARAPLLRVRLIRLEESRYVLMVDMHHIITDGVSQEIFRKDFILLYQGEELPPLPLQYKDYSTWQNRPEQVAARERQKSWWLREFEEEIPVIRMPYDFPRPPVKSFKGGRLTRWAEPFLNRRLNRFAKDTGTTLFMVLLSAYYILLSKHTRQEDIVVGFPSAGRKHADLQNIVGMFVNMLAIRNRPKQSKTFIQFLQEVKEKVIVVIENQDFYFEELVPALGLQGDPGRNPLFDVVFSMPNMGTGAETGPASEENQSPPPPSREQEGDEVMQKVGNITRFDFLLQAIEVNEGIALIFEYAVDLFKKSTVEELSKHYLEILDQLVENPDMELKEFRVSSDLVAIKSDVLLEDDGSFGF